MFVVVVLCCVLLLVVFSVVCPALFVCCLNGLCVLFAWCVFVCLLLLCVVVCWCVLCVVIICCVFSSFAVGFKQMWSKTQKTKQKMWSGPHSLKLVSSSNVKSPRDPYDPFQLVFFKQTSTKTPCRCAGYSFLPQKTSKVHRALTILFNIFSKNYQQNIVP